MMCEGSGRIKGSNTLHAGEINLRLNFKLQLATLQVAPKHSVSTAQHVRLRAGLCADTSQQAKPSIRIM